MLKQIKGEGFKILELTLHIGLGTFKKVEGTDIRSHKMHSEYFFIDPLQLETIKNLRKSGGKIIAIGTTVVRVLETIAKENFTRNSGFTDIFIYRPYDFRLVDGILTNFHLPKSTLMMLVSAFCGKDVLLRAYNEAILKKYKFFSYGDCMLIL